MFLYLMKSSLDWYQSCAHISKRFWKTSFFFYSMFKQPWDYLLFKGLLEFPCETM